MCNPAYLHIKYESLVVSESVPDREYEPSPGPHKWPDEEIAAIRVALQKLTATRILNSDDAEDLVQDTLLTMITKYPERGLEKGLLIWSMGILRKKVGNYYRKVQRYTQLGTQEIREGQPISQSTLISSPEGKVFHTELQELVDETLVQLPIMQRQAMELLIEGLGIREIVEQLHPERYQNVINRLHRGRQRMAKELAKYGYGPDATSGIRKMKRCAAKR